MPQLATGDISIADVTTGRLGSSADQTMRTVIQPTQLSTGVRDRQAALRSRYVRAPESAWATHFAWTEASGPELADPFRGTVRVGVAGREVAFALDDAVGGPHDAPAPGELFCAALAACLDSTLRLVAARMDVTIERLAVIVTGDVDARGSLGDSGVPSGFSPCGWKSSSSWRRAPGPGRPRRCSPPPSVIARCSRRCGRGFRSR